MENSFSTEIPRGWGYQIKKPSMGGVWIFSGTAHSIPVFGVVFLLR